MVMLTETRKRSTGIFEFVVLVVMTGLGFFGAPWWMVPIATMTLVCLTVSETTQVHPRMIGGRAMMIAGSATLAFVVVAFGFATVSYAGGYMLSALMYG